MAIRSFFNVFIIMLLTYTLNACTQNLTESFGRNITMSPSEPSTNENGIPQMVQPAFAQFQDIPIPDDIDTLRGKFGYFYEYNIDDINSITHIINTKYQTFTYFGVDKSELLNFVVKNRLSGIDRIVPVGKALDMGVVWDGYDIVRSLSRIIEVK